MPDYEKKARVISSGLVKQYKQVSRAIYAEQAKYYTGEKIVANMDYDTAVEQRFFYSQFMPDEWQEAKRVADSNYKQSQRLQKRINSMLERSTDCVFLTLTFKPEVLEKTSPDTRRQYVFRWLKSQCKHYVANIDFGGKNGREHYHAVCDARVNPKTWIYGNLDCKPVRYNPESNSCVKMAKYVAKLTNHAIKETTKRCALIYSRDV